MQLPSGALYEDLCYHCQQAAEKALKAVYVERGWRCSYIHDLSELIRGLEQNGLVIPDPVHEAGPLTIYAREARYPGLSEPVGAEEHSLAVASAGRVLAWAMELIA